MSPHPSAQRSTRMTRRIEQSAPAPSPRAAPARPDHAAPPRLRIYTLGRFQVWRGRALIPATAWRERRVAALFKYLLCAPNHRASSDVLLELFWPAQQPEAGLNNLRYTLCQLRAVLADRPIPGANGTRDYAYVRRVGDALALALPGDGATAPPALDAHTFATLARRALSGRNPAEYRAALTLYGGDFLPDDLYEDWTRPTREELRRLHRSLLLRLAELHAASGEVARAERNLRELLTAAPAQEQAARSLMRLLLAGGRRGEAEQVYRSLTAALRQEYEATPSAETDAVHATLLVTATRDAAPAARPASVDLPIQAPSSSRTNLPAPLTTFVGRAAAQAELRDLLLHSHAGCRLLTLTGAGGCGKTRLALEVAGALLPHYADGVWLVELAALREERVLPSTVLTSLGLREERHVPAITTLIAYVRPRTLLLVLDNCEHLVGPCATLATTLLRACPHLHILATSREGIGMIGEVRWPVPTLSLPPDDASLPALAAGRLSCRPSGPSRPVEPTAVGVVSAIRPQSEAHQPAAMLLQSEAVRLFLDRARASRPGFVLDGATAPSVVEVCRRLDGIPLAIELAAARLDELPVQEVAARLDDCFRLLTRGNRGALPRQQTLRATMDWSYDLLAPQERTLFRRLSVFAGGWTLPAAEDICSGHGIAKADMAPSLARLHARSLVLLGERNGRPRYRMLEPVRQYGQLLLDGGDFAGEG